MAIAAITSLLVLAGSGIYVAKSLHKSMDYIYANTLPSIEAINAINEDFLRLRLNVLYQFLQIRESSGHTMVRVEDIAEAIREQGAATNNIASQVERIAQMSEENNAAAGNSAQTANELDCLAKGMHDVVRAYRL